ncbi:MAG: hypothetical protein LBH97_05395 [Treponema sp.]|jgi:O-glycosyl hydrolase|nr:hypothetical protein [Treponema sp.]
MKYIIFFAVVPVLFLTCGTSPGGGGSGEYDGVMEIRYNEHHQVIDGFGGSNAWTRLPSDIETADEVVKLLYSKTEGAGFTILRNRIPFRERLSGDDDPGLNDGFVVRKSDNTYDYTVNADGTKTFNLNWNSWDLSGTRHLISRINSLGRNGPETLTIMSTPWTPPNNRVTQWKEDVAGLGGNLDYTIDWTRPDWWGRLKKDKYNDYADLLADYVKNFEARMGAPLAILSVQNEPNWKVKYESAYWSGVDIRDFLAVIGQRFPMKGVVLGENGLGIMAPEYENFNIRFDEMIQPSLNDASANSVFTHIGLHQYNASWDSSGMAGAKAFPQIIASGKRFWQTEVSNSGGPNMPKGTGIDNALFFAKMIHYDMTLAQTNAFLYWWLWTGSGDTDFAGSLIKVDGDTVIAALRLYAMGQYSRFIRPGWLRLEATTTPVPRVFSSAFRNPATGEIAVVLVNESTAPRTVYLNLEGARFVSLESWRTSATEKLTPLGPVNGRRQIPAEIIVNLPAKSISTFYGRVE